MLPLEEQFEFATEIAKKAFSEILDKGG